MNDRILADEYRDWSEPPERPEDEERLTTGGAAEVLRVSSEAVRGFVRTGQLSCTRTRAGQRLFRPADVLAFAGQRAKQSLSIAPPSTRVHKEPRQLKLRLFEARRGRKVT